MLAEIRRNRQELSERMQVALLSARENPGPILLGGYMIGLGLVFIWHTLHSIFRLAWVLLIEFPVAFFKALVMAPLLAVYVWLDGVILLSWFVWKLCTKEKE